MTLWFEFFDVLDKKEDESEYKGLFVQNVLIALQAYLRKGGSEQEIRNLTRKPMIKVAICLLYNSKCMNTTTSCEWLLTNPQNQWDL